MEINQTIREIRSISSRSEEIFLQLGNLFPSLLNRDGGTSLKTLKGLFSTLSKSDVDSGATYYGKMSSNLDALKQALGSK